ncbi:MAG: hypothetical protein GX316_04290 [Firmicutes bacterium]|nr:hypothetical protein [Bacillota bacterium]
MREHLCVVISEDNSLLREVVMDYLATFGISSIEAGNENDIMSHMESGLVDAVVLDLVSKSGFGRVFQLLDKMQLDPNLRHFPLIITTAFDVKDLHLSKQTRHLTDVAIIQKPYDLCRLRRMIIELTKETRASKADIPVM